MSTALDRIRDQMRAAHERDQLVKAQINELVEALARQLGSDVTWRGPASGSAGARNFSLDGADGDISLDCTVRADNGTPRLWIDSMTTIPGRGAGTAIIDAVTRIAALCDAAAVCALAQPSGYWTPAAGTPIAGSQFFARRGFEFYDSDARAEFIAQMLNLTAEPSDRAAISACRTPGQLVADRPHLWDTLGSVPWLAARPIGRSM